MTSLLNASSRFLLLLVVSVLSITSANAEKLRDLADFEGVRDNQLVGYGLVVGLDGTGDQTSQAPFTGQSMVNMLTQLGVAIPPGTNLQVKNVAAVIITATLPSSVRSGQKIDVVVSSIGNAKSLRGGTLLMAPLKGVDNKTYAIAQGNMLVGGLGIERNGQEVRINQQATGRISRGATVEREVIVNLLDERGTIDLQLKEASFTTVQKVVDAIDGRYGSGVATALDNRVVELSVPGGKRNLVRFMGEIENITIAPTELSPKVIFNARTGSIVLSGDVKLYEAAVAHGNITVTIDTRYQTSQPGAFSEGETVIMPETSIQVSQGSGTLNLVKGATLTAVVGALNELGATTDELMSILQALKASGALRAQIEII